MKRLRLILLCGLALCVSCQRPHAHEGAPASAFQPDEARQRVACEAAFLLFWERELPALGTVRTQTLPHGTGYALWAMHGSFDRATLAGTKTGAQLDTWTKAHQAQLRAARIVRVGTLGPDGAAAWIDTD